jgi:hypothetical protein
MRAEQETNRAAAPDTTTNNHTPIFITISYIIIDPVKATGNIRFPEIFFRNLRPYSVSKKRE